MALRSAAVLPSAAGVSLSLPSLAGSGCCGGGLCGARAGKPARRERDRRGGPQVGAGRHGGHVGGVHEIGAGAGGPAAVGRHVHDHRHRRGQDRQDHLAGGGEKAAGRVQAHDQGRGAAGSGPLQGLGQLLGGDDADGALDVHQEHRSVHWPIAGGLRPRLRRNPDGARGQKQAGPQNRPKNQGGPSRPADGQAGCRMRRKRHPQALLSPARSVLERHA